MKEILLLIEEDFISKFSGFFWKPKFNGKIYSCDQYGKLKIERNVLNRIINKTNDVFKDSNPNILSLEDKFLLIFYAEYFEKSENVFREDRNYYRSVTIDDHGLVIVRSEETKGFLKSPDENMEIYWEYIDYIELKVKNVNSENIYVVQFYEKDDTSSVDVPLSIFGSSDNKSGLLLVDILNRINKIYSYREINKSNDKTQVESSISEKLDKGDFQEALNSLSQYSKSYNVYSQESSDFSFFYESNAIALKGMGLHDEALIFINDLINLCKKEEIESPNAYKIKADIQSAQGDFLSSISNYAYSEETFTDDKSKKEVKSLKEYEYQRIKSQFVNLPYAKRKILFLSNNIYNSETTDFITVKQNDLPEGINFPIGHPHLNEVYTCHPLRNNLYLPLKDFQQELFYDRVNEFTYLLQCLGATKIEISSSKTASTIKKGIIDSTINIDSENRLYGASVNIKNTSNSNNVNDSSLRLDKVQTFSPDRSPFIPENLIWYKTEMSWQRLAEQRLGGNINHHQESISSLQNEIVSSHEIGNVNAGVKIILAKANVSVSNDYELNINRNLKFDWLISVDFANIEALRSNEIISQISKSSDDNLIRYKEDLLLMLEDDLVIDEDERKILDKKMKKYGLTSDEANMVEAELLIKHYTKDELLYIDQIKDLLEDGQISESGSNF